MEGEADYWRRRFIRVVLSYLGGLIAALVAAPMAGFYILPAFRRSRFEWFEVGRVDEFKVGEIALRILKPLRRPVWPEEPPQIAGFVWRKGPEEFVVFHTHCTHVG